MDTIESRIEAAKKKLKQLTAQKQQLEARKRTEESKRRRTDDTRRKILIRATILAKVERGEWPEPPSAQKDEQGTRWFRRERPIRTR